MKSQHTCLVSRKEIKQSNALKHISSTKTRSDTFYLEPFRPAYIAIDGVKNRQKPCSITLFGLPKDAITFVYASTQY